MLLMRILGWGRATELLNDDEETLEVDRFFRKHNFGGGTEEEARNLEPDVLDAVEAYCDGVNARFAESVPLEFKLVGYKPEPWMPADSLMLARMTGFLTLAQSQGEIERLFVEMVQAGVSDEHLEALFEGSTKGLDRDLLSQVQLGERIVPESVRWAAGSMATMASNNWCVSGSKTKSGAALLANDPHLETNRLPNVWVEQSFRWRGGYAIAVTMPGLPAPLIGRTQHLAWGATYTFMDASDSWIEECRGGKYRRLDDWREFEVRTETITRKKTGTLTEGAPAVTDIVAVGDASEDDVLRLAASIETASEHPLAAAIVEAAKERSLKLSNAEGFDAITGKGAVANVDGTKVAVGNGALLAELGISTEDTQGEADRLNADGKTAMHVAVDGEIVGVIAVADPIKPAAAKAVAELKAEGVRVIMATGDNPKTAEAVGKALGIDEIHAGLLPEDKKKLAEELRLEGKVVAVAGDGVNDAPALAAADVGIAMGTGADVALESAGITLLKGDLTGILRARRLAAATLANIKQNLAFAFAYNAIGVPIAGGILYPVFGLLLSPMIAAAAMSLSSVSVITNALRLRTLKL